MQALILVDIQNDFLPGGSLAVSEGDVILPLVNQLTTKFDLVVATQDWHPDGHGSFADSHPDHSLYEVIDLNGLPQVLWPIHCVQETEGAAFSDDLDLAPVARIFPKGTDPEIDSYSGFFDNGRRKATGMGDYLKSKGVQRVFVCGLATDFCVKFTALDAVSLGFETHLIEDASRGVNLNSGDVDAAVEEMRKAGVRIRSSEELLG